MKYEQLKSLDELKEGDIIRGRFSNSVYVVAAHYGSRVTAVSIADVTNPPEWEVLREEPELQSQLESPLQK